MGEAALAGIHSTCPDVVRVAQSSAADETVPSAITSRHFASTRASSMSEDRPADAQGEGVDVAVALSSDALAELVGPLRSPKMRCHSLEPC